MILNHKAFIIKRYGDIRISKLPNPISLRCTLKLVLTTLSLLIFFKQPLANHT
jgi:hypothetical protein